MILKINNFSHFRQPSIKQLKREREDKNKGGNEQNKYKDNKEVKKLHRDC